MICRTVAELRSQYMGYPLMRSSPAIPRVWAPQESVGVSIQANDVSSPSIVVLNGPTESVIMTVGNGPYCVSYTKRRLLTRDADEFSTRVLWPCIGRSLRRLNPWIYTPGTII